MNIILYKFKKKINSTARPSSTGTAVNVSLKSNVPAANSFSQSDDTYLARPVFFLSTIDSGITDDINAYNYCYAFGRYYWIRNIQVGINNAYTFFCEIDALASYREYIFGTNQYVSYASTGVNSNLDDPRNRLQGISDVYNMAQGRLWKILSTENPTAGTAPIVNLVYLMTIQDDSGLNTYLFETRTKFLEFWTNFMQAAWAQSDWSNVYGYALNLISSIQATSLDADNFTSGGPVAAITIQGQLVLADAIKLNTEHNLRKTVTVTLSNTLSDYRRAGRWSDYMAYIPYCGLIQLDSEIIGKSSDLQIVSEISPVTLDVGVQIFGDGFAGEGYGNAGLNVPFGQVINPDTATTVYKEYELKTGMIDVAKSTFNSIAQGNAPGALGNFIGGSIAAAASAYVNSEEPGYSAGVGRSGVRGGSFGSNFGAMYGSEYLITRITNRGAFTPGSLNAYVGGPVNAILNLTSGMGFVQCPTPVIELDTVSEIVEIIIHYMKGGIFLE